MESCLSQSVNDFLNNLGSRTPTPGGGATAALCACLAAAMIRMVAAYSIKPSAPPTPDSPLHKFPTQLSRIDQTLRRLTDEDAAAYENLQFAAKQQRRQLLNPDEYQQAVRTAIAVPLEIQALAATLLQLLDENKHLLNNKLNSDLAVAAHLGQAACLAGRENVLINTFELTSTEERRSTYQQADILRDKAINVSRRILDFVHQQQT